MSIVTDLLDECSEKLDEAIKALQECQEELGIARVKLLAFKIQLGLIKGSSDQWKNK